MKTGKVKIVAQLDKVLLICDKHGESYKPGKESLQPTALRSLLERSQEKLEAVNAARAAYYKAVDARKVNFAGIPKLATQVLRMVSASNASSMDWERVKLIQNKFYPTSV